MIIPPLTSFVPTAYRWGAYILIALAYGGFCWLQGAHHEELKSAKFEVATEALGKAEAARAKEVDARNQQRKKESDNAYAKTKSDLDGLYAAYASLRDQHTSSRTVSSLPTSAGSPERICFNRAKFADAVGAVEDGVPRILKQGDSAMIGLDAAKMWAKGAQ